MDSLDQPDHDAETRPAEAESPHGEEVSVPRPQDLRWPLVLALRDLGGAAHMNDIVGVIVHAGHEQALRTVRDGAAAAGVERAPRGQGPTRGPSRRGAQCEDPARSLVRSEGFPRFVADIKYKLTDESAAGPNADLYQLLAYTTAIDLPEGMLIYCLDADDPHAGAGTGSALGASSAASSAPASTALGTTAPAGTSAVSAIRVRHTDTVLHTYALDLSGTPDEVGKNMNDLADWIADCAFSAGSLREPATLTA